jgi:plastocyanin
VQFIVTVSLTLALAACGGSGDSSDKAETSSPPPPASAATVAAPTAVSQPASSGDVTKFKVVNQDVGGSGEYKFEPNELQFSVGETVEFSVTAETEFHTFNIDELNISQDMDAGETVTFTFTFDTPGEYRLYCIPHESLGMVGTIVVK